MKTAILIFFAAILATCFGAWAGADETARYQDARFIRGDANIDGAVDIADMIDSLGYLFGVRGHQDPHCLAAHDANDDGVVDISDAVYTANYLFGGGRPEPPPAPFPNCGVDPTEPRGGWLPCNEVYVCEPRTR